MIRIIIIQIIMQLAITLAELLLLDEQRIIHQTHGIKDVELEPLSEDQRIIHERIQARFQGRFVSGVQEGRFGGVVEEVNGADFVVFGAFDDGRFEAVEGEEVGDFFGGWVLLDVSYGSN
jgi:hypothetical protein